MRNRCVRRQLRRIRRTGIREGSLAVAFGFAGRSRRQGLRAARQSRRPIGFSCAWLWAAEPGDRPGTRACSSTDAGGDRGGGCDCAGNAREPLPSNRPPAGLVVVRAVLRRCRWLGDVEAADCLYRLLSARRFNRRGSLRPARPLSFRPALTTCSKLEVASSV